MTQSLQDFLEQSDATASLRQDSTIFIHPAIPHNKLYGAMSSYVPAIVQPSDIVVLIDDTVFGGAKEGLVLTEHAIYVKEAFVSPRHILLQDIRSIAWSKEFFTLNLFINGEKVMNFTQPSKNGIMAFVQALSAYLDALSSRNKSGDDSRNDTFQDQSTQSSASEAVVWACQILGISSSQITRENVQQAYRAKIREFHPDKYQSLPESIQQMLNEKTQDLNKAKDILSACYA